MPLLLDRTKHRLDYQEGKRQLNVEQVAAFAADELRDCPDAQVSDAPVDEDWTARFFESVKDVSADDMQKLWAKILAGEVKQPGSFSLRCLDTLRNLSRAEAELFTRVVPFVIDGEALHADSVTRRAGLSFTNVVRLSDAGLLGGQLQMEWSLDCKQSEARDLVLPADFVIEFVPRKTGKQVFPCYPLTEAGRQLLRVLSVEPNIGFVRALAEHLAVSNSDVTVYRGDDVFEAPAPTVPAVTTDTKSTDGTLT
jgi:hypothetical protein